MQQQDLFQQIQQFQGDDNSQGDDDSQGDGNSYSDIEEYFDHIKEIESIGVYSDETNKDSIQYEDLLFEFKNLKQKMVNFIKFQTLKTANKIAFINNTHNFENMWGEWGSKEQDQEYICHKMVINSLNRFNLQDKSHVGFPLYGQDFRPVRWRFQNDKNQEKKQKWVMPLGPEFCLKGAQNKFIKSRQPYYGKRYINHQDFKEKNTLCYICYPIYQKGTSAIKRVDNLIHIIQVVYGGKTEQKAKRIRNNFRKDIIKELFTFFI